MGENEFLTPADIAGIFHVPESLVIKGIRHGMLPAELVNGVYRVDKAILRQVVRKYLSNKAWSANKTHDSVIRILEGEKRGKVLDVGAGPGAMSNSLSKMGFDVFACDLVPEYFCLDDIQCLQVNINEGLSVYESDTFDFVVCLDVLEHIENHFLLAREIRRVLKPGGIVIFSTPNVAHIQSRILYLFTRWFAGFQKESFAQGHINPVFPYFFPKILVSSGLQCKSVTYNRGWVYAFLAGNSLLAQNGFEVPFKNGWFGQITIIKAQKPAR